ncbi:alpha/beta hydrolase family protein [Parvularcula maris]|uniref:Alpha/beta hydrolase n=1 Tax=Parvularcula maris TaxID=2965077 RepID=A0A9X2RGE2_9PROT|nr:alpha/beta hydrolase [Parvularcula maris]MCQ8183930.1 alpha/beta hydrolase [Parvularcula maris]
MSMMIAALAALLTLQTEGARPLAGHYTGAIIQDGTPIVVEMEVRADGEAVTAVSRFPEWLWYEPSADLVRVTEEGIVIEGFYGGDAVLQRDPRFGQLVGEVARDEGSVRVHLKPVPPPPPLAIELEEVRFTSRDGTEFSGTVVLPSRVKASAGIVLLHGRGCGTRSLGEAKQYALRGMSAITFDKRGAGESGGTCEEASHESTVADAEAAFLALARHRRTDAARIGLRGISAGAWTAQGLTEKRLAGRGPKPAFLITWIGPATSIRQQQLGSARPYAKANGLPPQTAALAEEAVRILTDPRLGDDAAYERLAAIREQAEAEGWYAGMFANDDLPSSPGEMDGLFLRRFRYDPSALLSELESVPYLAVFGADDPIVPLRENLEALNAIEEAGGTLRTIVVPGIGHTLEHGDQRAALPGGGAFLKTDTVEPAFLTATILFLTEHGFMP